MDTPTLPPAINDDALNGLGRRIFALWPTHVSDRRQIEERWMKNLYQVRKIYDPEVLSMIPADRSKAYPGMTAWMVRGTIARLMQMLWPQTEKNYGVRASPLPDLSTEQLQQVLDSLVQEKAQGGDASQVELSDAEIEKGIREFAKGKAESMEKKIDDDLQEMEFVTLARKVVRSATIYNIGILTGPFHKKVKARTWRRDVNTGAYKAVEVDKYKPLFEFLPVWNHYPDMTATDLTKQDGKFDRHIMTRAEVEELAQRPDFIATRITDYLERNQSGNYKAQWWESVMKGEPKSAQAAISGKESRKYEVLSYWGHVTGHELRGAGVTIADADLGRSFHSNVWMIDDVTIKAKLAPLGETVQHHHIFVFEDDDLSILGNGLCDTLRDSQVSLNETVRAALDNAGVIGPMAEINTDMLTPGQSMALSKHKSWLRESNGGQSDAIPAVRNVSIDSHIHELLPLIQLFLSFGDKESGLPPASLGDTSGGGSEALRTQRNASMFLGAAALPVRDTVRNYDTFTISMISALVAWNKKYDADQSRDGDHNIIARGSTSLIAKEVLAQSLAEFKASLTPDELPHIKPRALLIERAKANDIPIDDLMEDEDKAEQIIQRNAQAAGRHGPRPDGPRHRQVKEVLSKALEHEAKASSEQAAVGTTVLQTIIDAINTGNKHSVDRAKTLVAAHAADTGRQVGHAQALTAAHGADTARQAASRPATGAAT
ncbi:MAG: hypothetical protein IPM06_21400 [Rhizobiales bacterium]|nr:hypothetical protein [Hyphomicrobiales bacterium]